MKLVQYINDGIQDKVTNKVEVINIKVKRLRL